MTAFEHLHDECQVLPVRRHTRMRCVQQQLMNHIPSHPGNRLLKQFPPPRNMKQTLKSRYERYIEALHEPDSDDEISSKTRYQEMLKQIHTNEVKDYLDEREPNKVIDEKPPEISTKETLLPRHTRRSFAQLRNGYSPYLNSYLKRIGTVDYDCCPKCNIEPRTTRHLFNCDKNSETTVRPLSFWEAPIETANFLEITDSKEDTL